ncbi:uncharacterized protein [Glycine max]|uniref:uncharacterized protein n=1 Tax=Glycine max TaxID=3847 RepID=UPI0003DEADDD|nr:uncharacterized protein LOC102664462 [Glycine max]|eukprot:XP_006579072.1 uncharacterized protein LOC102664462 [Glycine max]
MANTEKNPNEECKVIFTRRESAEKEKRIEGELEDTKSYLAREAKKEISSVPAKKVPYPLVSSKKDKELYFARFLDIFDKLEITIPFREALQHMPLYTKFLKDLLTKKGKYINDESIVVEGNCSIVIQRILPQKFKDPGNVTISYSIGDVPVGKAFIDLGASINLMSLSMCRRIKNLKMASTRMTLQLAYCSITRPFGVVEDVLVKVHHFTFPMDFVIMDIEEDAKIPLILGWSFMLTKKCVVDMGNANLEMSVEDQKVTFNMFEALKYPKTCFKVEAVEQEADLARQHLKNVLLEKDEAKTIVNPSNPSNVFPGPRQVKAQTTPDVPLVPPPVIPPPATSSTDDKPSSSSTQPKQLFLMLQSLHHDQY